MMSKKLFTTNYPLSTTKGFTLIELLLVITLITVISALSLSFGIAFLSTQSADELAADIASTLRRAESQALFQKNDSEFGVSFLSNTYVLFEGSSYATRAISSDESFVIPFPSSVSGVSEIVFDTLTGVPSATGTIIISGDTASRTIQINGAGLIEIQ